MSINHNINDITKDKLISKTPNKAYRDNWELIYGDYKNVPTPPEDTSFAAPSCLEGVEVDEDVGC